MTEFIHIEGVHNFRDFGGYETLSGNKIRKGILFRSGQFANITEFGKSKFDEIAPKIIVDLRRNKERLEQPTPFAKSKINIIEELPHHNENNDGEPPHLTFFKSGNVTAQDTFNHMVETYEKLPFEPHHEFLFSTALQKLAANETPIIIHCAAGKDRTGFLCALILHILEVPKDIIFNDYLQTNNVPNLEKLIEKYANRMTEKLGVNLNFEQVWPLGSVHQDYLAKAFEAIEKKDGGLRGYLDRLQISKNQIEAIKANSLE